MSTTSSHLLKRLSAAFLNREKVLCVREIEPPNRLPHRVNELRRILTEKIGPERQGWLWDCYDFTAYKAPDEKLMVDDPQSYWEGITKNAILLSDGNLDNPAVPIQKNSLLFQSIGSARMPLTRLFYLPEHEPVLAALDNELLKNH